MVLQVAPWIWSAAGDADERLLFGYEVRLEMEVDSVPCAVCEKPAVMTAIGAENVIRLIRHSVWHSE
jgi:hypothetical protein